MKVHFPFIKTVVARLWALVLLAVAVQMAFVCINERFTIFGALLSFLIAILAIGLLRNSPIAYRWSARICILIAVFLPAGVINPFSIGDHYAAGVTPPTLNEILLWLIPVEVFLLFVAFVLDFSNKNDNPKP